MLAAIDGTGFITETMAYALLKDFIYPFAMWNFTFPEQDDDPEGMTNAFNATMTLNDDVLLYKDFKSEFIDAIRPGERKFFLCLGTDGVEDKIRLCLEHDIPVRDLTRAMYPVKTIGV